MEVHQNLLLLFFTTTLCLVASTLVHGYNEMDRKPYIIYMGELSQEGGISAVEEHHNLLSAAVGNEVLARQVKIHSYGRSFNGFVARLLPHEVERLSGEERVVSVFENRINKLHTTRSWDFLGITETVKRREKIESNIIIGLMDTGIYINSPSFRDDGYGPAPVKWRGKCVTGSNFTGCNKKVIGAKYYNLDNLGPYIEKPTPADDDGHGTHTSSTAAGNSVMGASLYGIAEGTARGGVPNARIAMYKVCWGAGCSDMDLLAAYDDAIADGVDLISVSIGGDPRDFLKDPIALGSFHAMKKGILTSCSAGNLGPTFGTIQNVAPWILTVGASSIDRQFRTKVKLGNGMKTSGISISTFSPRKKMYPLTNGAHATNVSGDFYGNISACDYGTLIQKKVQGKIVFCRGSTGQDYTIKELKGTGIIMSVDLQTDLAYITLLAGTNIRSSDGLKVDKYINNTKNPQATIYKSRAVNMTAPFVASFSSRGPSLVAPNILKPDLSAPGLSILAAYSKLATITGDPTDTRHSLFNILSGSSMACPHAAAAAVYVKSFHPDWSPAAIKSALMTTATPMVITDETAELGSGSGQISPRSAVHPGLVYDISFDSYVSFLCKLGYNDTKISLLIGNNKTYSCKNFKHAKGTDGINYPSMFLQLETRDSNILGVFYRSVTQVGYGNSVYRAKVTAPKGLSVKVIPNTLNFNKLHQTRTFKVVLRGAQMKNGTQLLSAMLEWNDSKHSVKSPIAVYRPLY